MNTPYCVLGIESSCDETAAALVRIHSDGRGEVLSDIVASQVRKHAPFGGVVPELASREHIRVIGDVITQSLSIATDGSVIDGIAVTVGPGLVGSLLVGLQAAKAFAFARSLPLVGVNHLHGHILAAFLDRPSAIGDRPQFPFVGLLVSGGHTALYRVDSPILIRELGSTRDDAAGEAFDKVAKMCGLGYPGGPIIDKLATHGDPSAIALPRALRQRTSLEFSFSGLKTAVSVWLAKQHSTLSPQTLADLAASVQSAIVDTLVTKTLAAVRSEHLKRVVVSGGVAANRHLRQQMLARCTAANVDVHIPPLQSCTDNAAMIAYAGAMRFNVGVKDDDSLSVVGTWPLARLLEVPAALHR